MSDLTLQMIEQRLVNARKEMRKKLEQGYCGPFVRWDELTFEPYGEQPKFWDSKIESDNQ